MSSGTTRGDLTPVDDVVAHVCAAISRLPSVVCETPSLIGRVPVADVIAPIGLPRFDHAAMDGVAVRASDIRNASSESPVLLDLVEPRYAGKPVAGVLAPGEACAIATGAPLPDGADTVVRKERLDLVEGKVSVLAAVGEGGDVRRAGEDLSAGSVVAPAGRTIRPMQLAVLGALGIRSVEVAGWPRIVVQPTGDEVAGMGRDPGHGCVNDAVGPVIAALITEIGGHVSVWPPVGDDRATLAAALKDRCIPADLVITIGGASVGDRDGLADVLGEIGTSRSWQVALRPGRPVVTGTVEGAVVVGLPGNPAAALAVFDLIARPVLAAFGLDAVLPTATARLTGDVSGATDRRRLVRGALRADADGVCVSPLEGGSGSVGAFSASTVWIDLPAGTGELRAGDVVAVRPCSRDVAWT